MAENSNVWRGICTERNAGCKCPQCATICELEKECLAAQHMYDCVEGSGERNWFMSSSKPGNTTIELWEEVKRVSSIRAKAVDNFIACYIDRTGADIKDLVLIEQESDDHLTHTWWVEPKEKK